MPALSLVPVLSLVAQISRQPIAPLRGWLRTTHYRLRPPCARAHSPLVRTRQEALLASAQAGLHQLARIEVEARPGPLPTIVVGGFVPDATEAFYLLRTQLLAHGSLYFCNYPRRGFSTALFLAQLEDLIEEVTVRHGQRPVLVAVSFGAGLALELLRRRPGLPLAGVVMVSPVACTDDLLDPAAPKPATLLGRVIKPYLDAADGPADGLVEKSRAVFLKMFESGAKNQEALRFLLSPPEARRLREAVVGNINAIDARGAIERVQALRDLPAPGPRRMLHAAPVLVLYAEKEGAVLAESSPTRREFTGHMAAWFPQGRCLTVRHTPEHPVQHASLIFHCDNFAPPFAAFYRRLRAARRAAA
jgi:pimeloyl-ACP methyl ester carboxylesterase